MEFRLLVVNNPTTSQTLLVKLINDKFSLLLPPILEVYHPRFYSFRLGLMPKKLQLQLRPTRRNPEFHIPVQLVSFQGTTPGLVNGGTCNFIIPDAQRLDTVSQLHTLLSMLFVSRLLETFYLFFAEEE